MCSFMQVAMLKFEMKLQNGIRMGITIFKSIIWGGISSDIRRYIAGYTFWNYVLRLCSRIKIKLKFRPYIRPSKWKYWIQLFISLIVFVCTGTYIVNRSKPFPPTNFLSWKCCLLFTSAYIHVQFSLDFCHGSKHYEPWSDCSLGSNLILVHIVCNLRP